MNKYLKLLLFISSLSIAPFQQLPAPEPTSLPFNKNDFYFGLDTPKQGQVVVVTNFSPRHYYGAFIVDTLRKDLHIGPGINFIPIARNDPCGNARIIVYSDYSVVGVDTSFIIQKYETDTITIPASKSKHAPLGGLGYQGLFARIDTCKQIPFMSDSFVSPLKHLYVTDRFGTYRKSQEKFSYHRGIDFRAKVGTKVSAIGNGVVISVIKEDRLGKTILLNHGNAVFSAYMHLSKMYVEEGDTVKAGEIIALSGASGAIRGPHLHLSLFVGKIPIDFMIFKDVVNKLGKPLVYTEGFFYCFSNATLCQ